VGGRYSERLVHHVRGYRLEMADQESSVALGHPPLKVLAVWISILAILDAKLPDIPVFIGEAFGSDRSPVLPPASRSPLPSVV
jgi:hypothetical protein